MSVGKIVPSSIIDCGEYDLKTQIACSYKFSKLILVETITLNDKAMKFVAKRSLESWDDSFTKSFNESFQNMTIGLGMQWLAYEVEISTDCIVLSVLHRCNCSIEQLVVLTTS